MLDAGGFEFGFGLLDSVLPSAARDPFGLDSVVGGGGSLDEPLESFFGSVANATDNESFEANTPETPLVPSPERGRMRTIRQKAGRFVERENFLVKKTNHR